MFLAADEEFPEQLTAAGLTRDAGAVYAIGRLASSHRRARRGGRRTPRRLVALLARGSDTLRDRQPGVAPYGRAAEATLRKRGLWDTIRPRLVFGDTIAQAAQFATTGNAVGGLIAYRWCKEPALADKGNTRSFRKPIIRRSATDGAAQASDASRRAVLCVHAGTAARTVLIKNGYAVPQ